MCEVNKEILEQCACFVSKLNLSNVVIVQFEHAFARTNFVVLLRAITRKEVSLEVFFKNFVLRICTLYYKIVVCLL